MSAENPSAVFCLGSSGVVVTSPAPVASALGQALVGGCRSFLRRAVAAWSGCDRAARRGQSSGRPRHQVGVRQGRPALIARLDHAERRGAGRGRRAARSRRFRPARGRRRQSPMWRASFTRRRSGSGPVRRVPAGSWTASTAAQRTSDPCLVIRPRCTVCRTRDVWGSTLPSWPTARARRSGCTSPISATNTAPRIGPTPGMVCTAA